jgi:hypothetical protein
MSYSLFANKKLHTEEISLFTRVNPGGYVHTDLTNFPTYIRSLPVIAVYGETRVLIQGHDDVMAFLRENEPKKPKTVRTPRAKKIDVEEKPEKTSVEPVSKKIDTPPEQEKIIEESTPQSVPTYTVENTESGVERSLPSEKAETSAEPLKKPRKRSSKTVRKKSNEEAKDDVIEL